MSLYTKAWLFIAWLALVVFTFPYWLPWITALTGSSVLGLLIFAGHGIAAIFLFLCPNCDFSLFKSEGKFLPYHHPWPNRICSRCGADHTKD
jgi:hypothetical protein